MNLLQFKPPFITLVFLAVSLYLLRCDGVSPIQGMEGPAWKGDAQ